MSFTCVRLFLVGGPSSFGRGGKQRVADADRRDRAPLTPDAESALWLFACGVRVHAAPSTRHPSRLCRGRSDPRVPALSGASSSRFGAVGSVAGLVVSRRRRGSALTSWRDCVESGVDRGVPLSLGGRLVWSSARYCATGVGRRARREYCVMDDRFSSEVRSESSPGDDDAGPPPKTERAVAGALGRSQADSVDAVSACVGSPLAVRLLYSFAVVDAIFGVLFLLTVVFLDPASVVGLWRNEFAGVLNIGRVLFLLWTVFTSADGWRGRAGGRCWCLLRSAGFPRRMRYRRWSGGISFR